MGRLNRLDFLDLSNNQLTGPFPAWAHNLRFLEILNLGQNDISGEIPLIVGEELNDDDPWLNIEHPWLNIEPILGGWAEFPELVDHLRFIEGLNDGGHQLHSLREFMRLLNSDEVFPHKELYKTLNFNVTKMFYRKHFDYIMKSNDLLWINHKGSVLISTLQEIIDEYVKAEDNRLLTKAFQTTLSDPVSMIEKLKEHEQAKQNRKESENIRRHPRPFIEELKQRARRINDRNSILPLVKGGKEAKLQQTEQSAGRIHDGNSILPTLMRSEKARRLIAIIGILVVVYDYWNQREDSKSD
jgi:hypothetical protein